MCLHAEAHIYYIMETFCGKFCRWVAIHICFPQTFWIIAKPHGSPSTVVPCSVIYLNRNEVIRRRWLSTIRGQMRRKLPVLLSLVNQTHPPSAIYLWCYTQSGTGVQALYHRGKLALGGAQQYNSYCALAQSMHMYYSTWPCTYISA